METLMGSCWKIFPLKFGEKDGLIWRPGDISLSRKENGLPRNQKRDVLLGFSLSVSFHCKTVRSVSSVASALSPENQTLVESEETDQILVADQPKTAHVRFKLTKECAFGQHFLIVGDDPCLGLWDPSDGVPFDWSDGHVWTAELDVPCGKVIKYKFILKVDDKTISWQPGPDRILETWETEKTIIVFEDWDHPELQDIAEEEEFTADLNDEKSLINSELLTVSENLSKTTQDEGTYVKKQLVGTNEHSSLDDNVKQDLNRNRNYLKSEESSVLEQEAPVLVSGLIRTITDETEHSSLDDNVKQDLNRNGNYLKREESSVLEQEAPVLLSGLIPTLTDETEHSSLDDNVKQDLNRNGNYLKREESSVLEQEAPVLLSGLIPTLTDETERSSLDDNVKQDLNRNRNYLKREESSVLEQEAPVLLPGLIPTLTDEIDEESPNEDEELKDEHISASLRSTETSKAVMENKKGFYGKEQVEILEGDMQWGRGMLQKFLTILGF